jgi:hypothetical protein
MVPVQLSRFPPLRLQQAGATGNDDRCVEIPFRRQARRPSPRRRHEPPSVELDNVFETTADRGKRGLEVFHHLRCLGAEALGNFASRIDASLPSEIDGSVRAISPEGN